MAVKFLTEEWAKAFKDALNSSDDFKQAAGSQSTRLQQVVNTPDGEKKYFMVLEGGTADIGMGDIDSPEATITVDYDTQVALLKGELNGTAAYMSGKLKVNGDLMRLMQMQGAQAAGQKVHASLDVDF